MDYREAYRSPLIGAFFRLQFDVVSGLAAWPVAIEKISENTKVFTQGLPNPTVLDR